MPAASKLRRPSSGDSVAAHIRRSILSGRLLTGERLRQDELAAELGVSRIPVREGIIALDREGWVRLEPNRGGVYVAGFTKADIEDHYELRGVVFGLVARRAAVAAGPDDVTALRALHQALRAAAAPAEFARTNEALLRTVTGLGATPRLRAALRVTPSIIAEDFFTIVPAARAIQESGMGKVVRAIRVADPEAGDLAMRATLRKHGKAVTKAFTSTGLIDGKPAEGAGHRPGPGGPAGREISAEVVARQIRQMVISGRLRPGQRLPQDDIAEAAGVSRIPVREAIIALQREGWLRVEPHRGAFVNALDDRAIADQYALYGRYFGFAARRAIERADDAGLDRLEAPAERLSKVSSAAAVERANQAFLGALIDLADSYRLRVALRSMVPVVSGNFFAAVPGAIEIQQRGIAALLRAVRARDINAAEGASEAMEREQGLQVVALLRSRAVIAGDAGSGA